tara:strand:+ start:2392 stop:3261 length:870 start_codon:yes stop_codon:yes gene_type:complete
MSKLALGSAQFGMKYGITNTSSRFTDDDIKEVLRIAKTNHIDTIDTAIAYGESEIRLGKHDLEGFKIITKIPKLSSKEIDIEKWINEGIESSLLRLNKNKIYAVLLHHPNDLKKSEGKLIYESLKKFKDQNVVSKLGVSVYSPSELDNLISNFDFEIVQAPFNVIDNSLINSGWMKKLNNNGIEIHTRSTFLQGLLLSDLNKIPTKFNKWKDIFESWDHQVSNMNISKMEACLNYSNSFNEINKIIVGIDNLSQFKEILSYDLSKDYQKLPSLNCHDKMLINPSNWESL